MDSTLGLPLNEFIDKYVLPAGQELARKSLAGEPLDELEQRIVRDAFERLMRLNEEAIREYFKD